MDKEQGVPVEGHTLPCFYGYAIYALLSVLPSRNASLTLRESGDREPVQIKIPPI